MKRKISLENLKQNKIRVRQQNFLKSLEIRDEDKMNEIYDRIGREKVDVELREKVMVKQRLRANIIESFNLREKADREMAENLLRQEA